MGKTYLHKLVLTGIFIVLQTKHHLFLSVKILIKNNTDIDFLLKKITL